MILIRPCADLRNNYNEISKVCHETNEPVYITKNGYNDLVILSNEAFEDYENERISKLIAEHFDKNYPNFEEFKKDIFQKLDESLKQISNQDFKPMLSAVAELEEKYDFNEQ